MKVFIPAYFITSGHSVQKSEAEAEKTFLKENSVKSKKEAHHYLLNKWRLIQIIIKRLLLWRS